MTTREDELTRIPPCSCDGPGSLECSTRFLCEADRAAYAAGKAEGLREADTLRAEVARLRAELENTVTTAYHDEIVRDAMAERLALRDAVTVAIHACTDVTRPGRFAPSVNPVRWVAELEAHLRDAVKA